MMKDFINMITIQTYKKFPDRTFGLGQDVSTDLLDIVRVPALFIKNSKIHKELEETRLKQVTLDAGAPKEIYDKLLNALSKDYISDSELVSLGSKYGRKPYASGLIRAIFDGQRGPAIKDWPAKNYLAVAVGMGLVDLDYTTDTYHITDLGKEAVALLDKNDLDNLRNFMLERLYEYPYAAWLIRVVNTDRNKWYTKFDLGDNFGFIDEPGFSSLPEDLYVDAMFEAEYSKNKKLKSQIKSNYESTADKYMRWLAGVLVKYNLLERKKKVYTRIIDGKEYSVSLTSYKVTLQGVRSLNRVNGGSRFSRSIKRVRWEYLAPKVENAPKRKTARALMLKFLSEAPNGMTAEDMSVKS
uniref:restriction endonuclease FokI catalytic domain-containing protein n=1 Tax=Lactobacillus johnsonii TaxID=33959 RepID=UPI003D80F62E